MYHNCRANDKDLVIKPFINEHYPDQIVNMCQFFSLPASITCSEIPKHVEYTEDIHQALSDRTQDTCYDGRVFYGTMPRGTGSLFMVRAVELHLPLAFSDIYVGLFQAFRGALGIQNSPQQGQHNTYAVVHWRRGDQLRGRCRRGLDTSVNCGTADDLAEKVHQHCNLSIIYVATDEPQDSTAMETLRSAGFVTFSDVATASFLGQTDSLTVLAVEVQLMLDAEMFLAWGISEVNDVVEHERMQRGKRYCVGQEGEDRGQVSWCNYRG